MKIAYNPKTAAALTSAPANNDITFDLSGLSIYVRGERFKGTDTTYTVFKKHDENGGGYDGLVPVPDYNNGLFNRFLREDGTWQYITGTSDISVYQSEDDTSDFRPVVLGLTHSATLTELVNPVTGQVYVTSKIYACPSTGILYATKLYSNGKEVLTEHQSLADYVTLNTPQTITGRKTFYSQVNITNGTTNDDGTQYTRPIIYMDSSQYMIYSDTESHTIIRGSAIRIQTSNDVDTVNILPDTIKTLAKIESDQTIKGTQLISTETTNSPLVVSSSAVVAKLNSDLLDGYHANGLFEKLDNDGNNLSITIGGTKKNLIVNYATQSGKLGYSIKFKNTSYQDVTFDGSKDIDLTGGIYYSLNSDYAKLLKINSTSTSTIATGIGTWAPVSGKEYVFRQKWTNSAASSDTADLAIYLDGNLTANMCLDGYYYSLSGFKKSGSDDSYVLLGGGGHKTISSIITSGYIGTTQVQTSSKAQALSGISSINGRLTISAESDLTRLGFGGVHNVVFGEPGYAHRGYYFRPSYSASGNTITEVFIQNASAANSPAWTTTHAFYSNGNATHTGSVTAGQFIANNASGPHFTGTSTAGNWAYLRLNNGSTYWDIATRSNSGSGGLWLARLSGADNGIFVSTGNNVGISTSSPSYKLHIAGDSYTTGWSRASSGFYVENTGVHFTHQGSVGEIDMTSNNEFLWGSSNANLFFNYRAVSRGTTVTNYIWNAGSSTSYASHTLGVLTSRGDQTLYGLTQTCNKANNSGYMNSALQIREYNFGGAQSDTWAIAPRLSWHWSGRVQTQIGLASNNELYLSKDQFSHAYKLVYETGTWGININGNATSANYIYTGYISNLNVPSSWNSDGARLVYDTYSNSASNKPISHDNANAIITLFKTKHGTSSQYVSQLSFPDNGRIYSRYAAAGSFQSWNTIAYTSDIPTVTNYYWANVRVSASSSTGTYPTFANMHSTGRVYLDEWIQFSGGSGLYWPNANGAHLYANTTTSYAGLITQGSRGGYCGLQCGPGTTYMTVMSHVDHQGLFNESRGRWIVYYNRPNDRIGIYDSDTGLGYGVQINQRTGIKINSYPSLHLVRTDSGETSMYFSNNTAGWAIGINPWGIGAGQFAIGQYSGTGSSTWRFRIDNYGYCYTSSYLNLGAGNEKNASNPPYVWGVNGSDNYLRTYATSSLHVGYAANAGNADTLDGVHNGNVTANYYRADGQQTLNLSSLNANTWYPCVMWAGPGNSTPIRVTFTDALSGHRPPWSTHSSGFSFQFDFEWIGGGWGTIPWYLRVYRYAASFGGETACYGLEQRNNRSALVLYMRGGTSYYYRTTDGRSFTVYSTTTNIGDSTYPDNVSPRTSKLNDCYLQEASSRYGTCYRATYADNATNADTVDGQHFSYSNSSNSPTYLWATNSNGSSFLAARGSISVNYANSAGSATTASKLSTNAGSSAKPVYFSGGIPVACGYSFKGLSTQPVVLVSGYFYRNYLNQNTWYFTGYKHSEIGSPSFSVNGGVMTLTFLNTVNVYFISACAQSRLNFSGHGNISATQSASNTEYSWRSEGAYWFNTYVSNSSKTSYLYIRSFRMTDKNNDSWGSYASSWKQEEDAIHSVSFTIFGYI